MEALYKLQPNKVHSKKMQYMKVHHGEVLHHNATHLHAPRELTYGNETDPISTLSDVTSTLGVNHSTTASLPTIVHNCVHLVFRI